MEKSKKLDDDLKQLEQTNVQLGSANLQLRQELADKTIALDQAESARRQFADRVRLLEDVKASMEEEAREADKLRAELNASIAIKDELIGNLEDERQSARKEAEQASGQKRSLAEFNANLEQLNAKLKTEYDLLKKQSESTQKQISQKNKQGGSFSHAP